MKHETKARAEGRNENSGVSAGNKEKAALLSVLSDGLILLGAGFIVYGAFLLSTIVGVLLLGGVLLLAGWLVGSKEDDAS